MQEQKLFKVERPDDPRRCQAVTNVGQCLYVSVEDATYCTKHGGGLILKSRKDKALRQYRLERWGDRVEEFANSDQLKTLNDEIGILRMTLEHLINECKTPLDMTLNHRNIAELVVRIEKVVISCTNLERQSGQFLDKGAALQLAASMIEIIAKYVSDPEIIDAITAEMTDAILSIRGIEK